VTKFPPLLRQSRLAGAPTMGGSAMTIISAPTGREGFTSPKRALLSAGLKRVIEVSPACQLACLAAIAALTCETSSARDNEAAKTIEAARRKATAIRVFLMAHVL
jgi:hypothetical protein